MVWGCFSYHGVGKLIVLPNNETVNKESYVELLSDHLDIFYKMCRVSLLCCDTLMLTYLTIKNTNGHHIYF